MENQNMSEKQIEQREKLLKDQLTIINWFEPEFKKRLGEQGLQSYIDRILDEILHLRKLKKELYGK